MNYHNIKKCNMLNGEGLRVVLFVSGCSHGCKNCQNQETWNAKSGIQFDTNALNEIFAELELDHINGLTLSGGDPLNKANLDEMDSLVSKVKFRHPEKTIWIYSGYTIEFLMDDNSPDGEKRRKILRNCDVLVDGKYEESRTSQAYPFAGSTNQRIINIKEYLQYCSQ